MRTEQENLQMLLSKVSTNPEKIKQLRKKYELYDKIEILN